MDNQKTYENKDVVREYTVLNQLFEPEKKVLDILSKKLADFKMLDIGVGAGRTSGFFAPLVKEYIGIDYSEEFVKVCKNRFSKHPEYTFIHCDVREMKQFANKEFNLVLFSYNGLDYISHNHRALALKEISRVVSDNGLFIFSSHNLNSVYKLYKVSLSGSVISIAKNCVKLLFLLLLNGLPGKYKNRDYAIINDGAHRFRLKTYYIKPGKQLEQLEKIGYNNICAFDENGEEISLNQIDKATDTWIYYLYKK